MKNILLLFFVVPFFTHAQTGTKYYLKARESTVTNILIDSTVNVLNNRLSNQGYRNTSVSYDNARKQFVITANDFIDTNYIKLWLIKRFRISIYEVYNIEEIVTSLSEGKMDKATNEKRLHFYNLLNINAANFQSFKHSSYLGTLRLKDTAQFTRLTKNLESYLPADVIFAFPRKLSSAEIPVVEVYGLQKNKFKMDINEVLLKASAGKDEGGRPFIKFEFSLHGKALFSALTEKNINRPIAITIDDRVCAAPNVVGKIEGGVVEITGSFEMDEAKEIVDILLTGYLALNLSFISK